MQATRENARKAIEFMDKAPVDEKFTREMRTFIREVLQVAEMQFPSEAVGGVDRPAVEEAARRGYTGGEDSAKQAKSGTGAERQASRKRRAKVEEAEDEGDVSEGDSGD